MKTIKTLIVAAHASELKPLISLGKRHFVINGNTAYLSAGIGPVAAAFGLTHFLEDFAPNNIIAIGTAGVINKKIFKIGDVVCAKSVTTVSGLAAVYTPGLQEQRIAIPVGAIHESPSRGAQIPPPAAPPLIRGAGGISGGEAPSLRNANVYAPQEITRSITWQRALAKASHDVEHLESFAFALVAQKFKIPIQIFLGLTNVIGPNAHKEWAKNAAALVQATCDVVKQQILFV